MANPRNVIAFDGIGGVYATFKTDNSTIVYDAAAANGAATTMIGKAVSLSAAGTVQLAADGEAVVGKLIHVEADNKALVQVGGFCSLPAGTGASLTLGKTIVGALLSSAKGYIREAASATAAELVLARGRIIDAGTTTAVVVQL